MCETVTRKSMTLGQHRNESIEIKQVELPNQVNERSRDVLETCMEIVVQYDVLNSVLVWSKVKWSSVVSHKMPHLYLKLPPTWPFVNHWDVDEPSCNNKIKHFKETSGINPRTYLFIYPGISGAHPGNYRTPHTYSPLRGYSDYPTHPPPCFKQVGGNQSVQSNST